MGLQGWLPTGATKFSFSFGSPYWETEATNESEFVDSRDRGWQAHLQKTQQLPAPWRVRCADQRTPTLGSVTARIPPLQWQNLLRGLFVLAFYAFALWRLVRTNRANKVIECASIAILLIFVFGILSKIERTGLAP